MNREIKPLARVQRVYRHHLNSRSSFLITRVGTYHGLVDHRASYKGKQLASVYWDGNKWESSVPIDELRLLGDPVEAKQ